MPPRFFLWLALLQACTADGAQAAICRAAPTANGAANGATWQDAMTLPAALSNGNCDEIWLKQGLYKPGMQRSDTFNIPRPLKLYGGFVGGETSLAQRGTNSRLTVLSGDIDGDDTGAAANNGITANASDIAGSNSYHVVRIIPSSTNPAFTPTNTVIDGLTITGGQATGSNPDHMGAGLLCQALSAGRKCSPRIANVTFSGNRATNVGGGMLTSAKTTGESSPVVTHSTFSGNEALYGGGLAVDVIPNSDATTGSPSIAHSTFSGNAAGRGGAVYLAQTVAASVEHVTFANNTASAYGGALHAQHGAQASVAASVFWGNTASTGGNQIGLANTTDGNGSTGTSADVGNLTSNIVQGGCAGVYSVQNATACTGTPITDNPQLAALIDNGGPTWTMRPDAASPALNAATCTTGQTDQRGAERPVGACDIGAVERLSGISGVVPTASGSTDQVRQITLSWPAISNAVYYVVTLGAQEVCRTSALACVVTGLGDGQAYHFDFKAFNDGSTFWQGNGSGTTLALPGAPESFNAASNGVRQASLTWAAPASGGAAASYTVTRTDTNATVCDHVATLGCTVTGLANGTAYTFHVVAHNAAGDSASASTGATTLALPVMTAAFAANPGVRELTLVWQPATGATSYVVTDVTTATPAEVCNTSATTCTVTGLGNGDTRTYMVVVRNAAGDSAPNAAQGTTYPLPATPAAFTATPGQGSVTLAWSAAANAARYVITNATGGGSAEVCNVTALTCTVSGLNNGTAYTFRLVARSLAGDSPPANAGATPVRRSFSGAGPLGTVTASFTGGGTTCTFDSVQLQPAPAAATGVPTFAHGLLAFVLAGCDASDVTMTVTYPTTLDAGTRYFKQRGAAWQEYPATLAGTTATFTLHDGGPGDDDGDDSNGRIVDPGGPGLLAAPAGAVAIPTLSQWGMLLLSGLMPVLGLRMRRKI